MGALCVFDNLFRLVLATMRREYLNNWETTWDKQYWKVYSKSKTHEASISLIVKTSSIITECEKRLKLV